MDGKTPRVVRATAQTGFATSPRDGDPYCYQVGFNNRFASEAVPGTLPEGRSVPQKVKWDLYSEQINGTGFVSSREHVKNVWLYRIRPGSAHSPIQPGAGLPDLESDFSPLNPKVHVTPQEMCWPATPIPGAGVNFYQGLKTLCGSGEPGSDDGIAIHVYAASASMTNEAFASMDGDMLILPQQGRLDIQTELGHLMVKPGEVAVVQRGIRFKVSLPDEGGARGYVQEIYGCHYELAELGPVGTNGMALPRDFEAPLASFDIDDSLWTCTYKMCGRLFQYTQNHTPFDVVAWHGNYVPYKYDMARFVNIGTTDKEQMDPSIYTVLTAKSLRAGVSLSELMIFTPKWSVATNTFRPPYYHRNTYSEIYGMICGNYPNGGTKPMGPGALSFTSSYMPHGAPYKNWKAATEEELTSVYLGEGTIGFMFHTSRMMTVTDYALNRSGVQGLFPGIWDDMKGHFLDHLDEINTVLEETGAPKLDCLATVDGKPAVNGAVNGMVNGAVNRVNGH